MGDVKKNSTRSSSAKAVNYEALYDLIMKLSNDFTEFKQSVAQKSDLIATKVDNLAERLDQAISKSEKAERKIDDIEIRMNTYEQEIEKLKRALKVSSEKNQELSERLTSNEEYSRRENLIFDGVSQSNGENCALKIKKILSEKMGVLDTENIKFQRIHRMPFKVTPQPIIVRFLMYSDRDRVWNQRKELKGSNIFIREDYSNEVVNNRKKLFPIMKRAQELGHNAYLSRDKLVIDKRHYTTKSLHLLPPELQPDKVATRNYGNILAFFTKATPMSNFYPCDLNLDDKKFLSVEQYLQYKKASYSGSVELANEIMQASTPEKCKAIGNRIKTDDGWLPYAKETVKIACLKKFSEDDQAKETLLKTGDSILAEASTDRFWGTGLSLQNLDNANKSKWLGQNVLGDILMMVRSELNLQ